MNKPSLVSAALAPAEAVDVVLAEEEEVSAVWKAIFREVADILAAVAGVEIGLEAEAEFEVEAEAGRAVEEGSSAVFEAALVPRSEGRFWCDSAAGLVVPIEQSDCQSYSHRRMDLPDCCSDWGVDGHFEDKGY